MAIGRALDERRRRALEPLKDERILLSKWHNVRRSLLLVDTLLLLSWREVEWV